MKETIVGIFNEEEMMVDALRKLNERKNEIVEVYTPYPVHAVFEILRRKTRLPLLTFLIAILGLVLSYMYMYWTSVIDYPLIYGGKPIHSFPSFILIAFVSMISLSVLLSVIAFLIRTGLFPGKKPEIFDLRTTDNAFIILVHKDPEMHTNEVKTINSLFWKNGAIEVVEKQIKE